MAGRPVVYEYAARRRPEIVAETKEGHAHIEDTVPQQHLPGEEAEVDFADVWVRIGGEMTKCHLFTLRRSYSGKAIHRVFKSETQKALLEGHLEAFRAGWAESPPTTAPTTTSSPQ